MRKSKWISVEDRMPEEGQEVLTVVKPFKNSKSYHCEVFRYENKHWVYTDDDEVVTHWQPLPELPKELKEKV